MTRSLNRAALAAIAVAGLACAANAQVYTWNFVLDGPSEAPPNASPGIGSATITWDTIAHTMRLQLVFNQLLGATTAAHIHGPTAVPGAGTAGVATTTPSFVGFPLGVTFGTMDQTYNMTLASSYNPSFVTANGGLAGAEAALLNAMLTNRAYLNLHTQVVPGGEIRGFIPTPGAASLLALTSLAALRRRR